MHSKNISLFFIVASLTSTSLGLHHLAETARRSFDIILARQTTSGSCVTVCNTVQSTVSACGSTISCICTSAVAEEVQTCINCAIGATSDPSDSVIKSAESLKEAYETTCPSASITINTNAGTPQSTSNTATLASTTPVSVTTPVTRSKVVIGPSSTTSAPNTALSVGSTSTSTSTASTGGLPLNSSASPNKIILHWTVALLGLAAGNLLVF